jgi:hypothetical protein
VAETVQHHDEGFVPAVALSAILVVTPCLALRSRTGPWIVLVDAVDYSLGASKPTAACKPMGRHWPYSRTALRGDPQVDALPELSREPDARDRTDAKVACVANARYHLGRKRRGH